MISEKGVRMRALVVDDSKAVRMILGQILRDLGFEVAEARHGREALVNIHECGKPDLALVDWNMPEMDGLDFIRLMRSEHDFDNVMVMMVTTENDTGQVTKALEAGANEYVMKPFTKEIILEKLSLLGIE